MSFSLNLFIATAQSVDTLLWLLYVSLTVAGLAVLLLAARTVAMRRSAEITVIRARGGSLRQIAVGTGRDAALLCVPAAVTAAVLAIVVVPGAGSAQGAGSAAAGGRRSRQWPPRSWGPRSSRPGSTGCPAAEPPPSIASGSGPGWSWRRRWWPRRWRASSSSATRARRPAGVNFYTSSAPVLVAIPAVIVVLRLYPLALRGLLRASARSSRAPAFLGLARASRTGLTPALPALALVLALTVAAFAGMVRGAVIDGEVAASWHTAGADATVTSSSTAHSLTISPAAARAVAAVPGVTHAAEVMNESWATRAGSQVRVLAVDPASYAELVARTSGFPQVRAGLLATPGKSGRPSLSWRPRKPRRS